MKQPPPVIPSILGMRVASENFEGSSGIHLDSNNGETSNAGGGTRINNMYKTNASNIVKNHNIDSGSLHLSSD
jgi:hypothetical protein